MEIINFTSLFEVFIGFNFAYAGVDSFSETILGYIYFKYNKINEYKTKIDEHRNKLNSILADRFIETEAVSDFERISIAEKRKSIDKLNDTLKNLQDGNLSNIKSEIYKLYDKNKYKPLFLLNGIYFGIILLLICIIGQNTKNVLSQNILNTLNITSFTLLILNLYVGFTRLNKINYGTIKKILLTILIAIFILLLLAIILSYKYLFLYTCSFIYRIDISCSYILIILTLLLMLSPIIFELFSLFNFINKEFINRIDNAYNLLTISIDMDKKSTDISSELEVALKKLRPING